MNLDALIEHFRAVWLVDFEFTQPDGEHPTPLCFVAKELFSGQVIRAWCNESVTMAYGAGANDLFVSYYATAELSCHLSLNWPLPRNVVDLFAEFRKHTCGLSVPSGNGLLGALAYFGLPGLEGAVKDEMRGLAIRGGPYTEQEQAALLDYCESDVHALERLFWVMLDKLDLGRALIRGKYMAAVTHVEWRGTPIDRDSHHILQAHWSEIKLALVEKIDSEFGVYDGFTFRRDRFKQWLRQNGIAWPLLESGEPALDEDTFKDMAKIYPRIAPLKELRYTLGKLRLHDLRIGRDDRNRCSLSPFRSITGRNQPSNSAFIFGPSVFIRSLIKPSLGRAVAYIDYSQQEFGIAAYLSGDDAMMRAYQSGDPYLAFAKQAGVVPPDASKASHKAERDVCKNCVLGVQYGMGEQSLGFRIGQSPAHGRELLAKHRTTYPMYWRWSESVQDHAMFHGVLHTTFGWQTQVGRQANPRSLRNFPVQANGAEMLRMAIILGNERGVEICAPVHDALLIEAATDEIDDAVRTCQAVMSEASELILPGFPLRTDAKIFRYPERYSDERGAEFWRKLWDIPLLSQKLER